MKPGARIALGVGIGYFLGRTRKMRLALTLAAAGASGTLGKSPGGLLRGGASALASSPEIAKLTERLRGELVNAAKAAAVTAASGRIDSLSERIQSGGGSPAETDDTDEDTAEAQTQANTEKPRADESEDHDDSDSEPKASKDEKSSVPAQRQRRTRRETKEDSATEDKERPRAGKRAERRPVRRARR